jgi:hypothetical protein
MDENTTEETSESWSAYRVTGHGCELRHPPGWTLVSNAFGAIVATIAPARGDATFCSNFNVVLQDDGAAMTQDECIAAQLAGLQTTLDGVIVLESEPTTVGDLPGARALAAYRDGDLELTLEQWMAPVAAGTLVLSATALTSDFPHDAEALRKIAASVRLND